MIPRPIARTAAMRRAHSDPRERKLESLAAEFALLAQRRARMVHQIDMLDQQREAAAGSFNKLQARMAWLAQRIDEIDPDLREPAPRAPTPREIPTPRRPEWDEPPPVVHGGGRRLKSAHAGTLSPAYATSAAGAFMSAPYSASAEPVGKTPAKPSAKTWIAGRPAFRPRASGPGAAKWRP